jgi:hypothetical protein
VESVRRKGLARGIQHLVLTLGARHPAAVVRFRTWAHGV